MTLMARTSVLTTWLRLLDWAFIDAWYVCISYLSNALGIHSNNQDIYSINVCVIQKMKDLSGSRSMYRLDQLSGNRVISTLVLDNYKITIL